MKNFNEIWQLLSSEKMLLDKEIKESAHSDIDLNNQVTNYILESGGKRIRPLVLLLIANALKYEGNLHYKLAAAVEFIHTATLLHDDVVDESEERRNRPTANNKFGNAAAVLVGDFLYTRAFQLISIDLEAAKIMSNATNELAMGEVMQLMNINNYEITEEQYLKTIHLKTAVLFSVACEFASIIANCNDLAETLSDYGKYLGYAFQIADDVLDYVGDKDKMGKNIGDDLAERKLTLPIIHCLNSLEKNDTKRTKLLDIIAKADISSISEAIEILNSTKSIDYSLKLAYSFADKAKLAIDKITNINNDYKKALLILPDLAVQRES